MDLLHPWNRRVQAETLRACPLEDTLRALGYRRDPDDAARWRRRRSAVSVNGFMFYDHRRGYAGSGAIDLVIHERGCSMPEALAILSGLPRRIRQNAQPLRSDRLWPGVERRLVAGLGIPAPLVTLCRDLGLLYADCLGNAVFVRRDAAGKTVGAETLDAGTRRQPGNSGAASPPGGFWMSWNPDWPRAVLLAENALEALSILALHLTPELEIPCVAVSAGAATPAAPKWIEAWNPVRIFCAWGATPNGDQNAAQLMQGDNRIVRLRPALDGQSWNDMLLRDRDGEPLDTDDRRFD